MEAVARKAATHEQDGTSELLNEGPNDRDRTASPNEDRLAAEAAVQRLAGGLEDRVADVEHDRWAQREIRNLQSDRIGAGRAEMLDDQVADASRVLIRD